MGQNVGTRAWEPECGNQNVGTRTWEPERGNQNVGTRNRICNARLDPSLIDYDLVEHLAAIPR